MNNEFQAEYMDENEDRQGLENFKSGNILIGNKNKGFKNNQLLTAIFSQSFANKLNTMKSKGTPKANAAGMRRSSTVDEFRGVKEIEDPPLNIDNLYHAAIQKKRTLIQGRAKEQKLDLIPEVIEEEKEIPSIKLEAVPDIIKNETIKTGFTSERDTMIMSSETYDNANTKTKFDFVHSSRKRKNYSSYLEKLVLRRTHIREALDIHKFIILPDDKFKTGWSGFVLFLLMYATIITPYRTAFHDEDPIGWIVVDALIDLCFLADMFFNFFMAYYDKTEDLVLDRKRIACRYLKTWFLVDFIAIIPFNYMLKANRDYGSLSRLARLPRLYRLLKMTKILKTVRVCREKNNWMGRVESYIPHMSIQAERLLAFFMIGIVICHIVSCLWFLLAKIEGIYPDSWVSRYGLVDASHFHIYTICFYFTVTTVTTVGYGDISAGTSAERWFGIGLMMIGVMCYSFSISSLSSMLSTDDRKKAEKNDAMESLDHIDMECQLDTKLFLELRKAIALKYKKEEYFKDVDSLVQIIPRKLRRKLNSAMHSRLVHNIPLFSMESENFLEYFSKLLKPRKVLADEAICEEGDPINEIYFIIQGKVEYVLSGYKDYPFLSISKDIHFGDLDIVHCMLTGTRITEGKRLFTARAKEDCEILVLSQTDMFKLFHRYQEQAISIFDGSDLRLTHALERKRKLEKALNNVHKKMNLIFESNAGDEGKCTLGTKYYTEGISEESMSINESEGESPQRERKSLEEDVEESINSNISILEHEDGDDDDGDLEYLSMNGSEIADHIIHLLPNVYPSATNPNNLSEYTYIPNNKKNIGHNEGGPHPLYKRGRRKGYSKDLNIRRSKSHILGLQFLKDLKKGNNQRRTSSLGNSEYFLHQNIGTGGNIQPILFDPTHHSLKNEKVTKLEEDVESEGHIQTFSAANKI